MTTMKPGLPALTGTSKQIEWAESIRSNAVGQRWPAHALAEISRVSDATWWIANKGMLPHGNYKKPAPHQLFAAEPAADESEPDTPAPPKPGSRPMTNRAVEPLKEASLEDRVSDAEQWARSVSRTPKLAEAAILAVLSRLYKEPMKGRLKQAATKALNEASDAIAKDVDAIMKMLSCLALIGLTGCSEPSVVTVYTSDGRPVVVSQTFNKLTVTVKPHHVAVEFVDDFPGTHATNTILVEDESFKMELQK